MCMSGGLPKLGLSSPKSSPKISPSGLVFHDVLASTFADPSDVESFKFWLAKYKEDGHSAEEAEQLAYAHGDNGIGCWGDDTTSTTVPMCALPPDDMIAQWSSVDAAKHRRVLVVINGISVSCLLADRMPWKRHITNGCGIDLNPAAATALRMRAPQIVKASWAWVG